MARSLAWPMSFSPSSILEIAERDFKPMARARSPWVMPRASRRRLMLSLTLIRSPPCWLVVPL